MQISAQRLGGYRLRKKYETRIYEADARSEHPVIIF